jgi:hypothetical protein
MARVDPDVVLILHVVLTANMTDLGADQRDRDDLENLSTAAAGDDGTEGDYYVYCIYSYQLLFEFTIN